MRVFTGRFCACWVCVAFVCFVCFLSVSPVKTPAFNSRFTFFCEFLVVDRPCPVLARQCRKKNHHTILKPIFFNWSWTGSSFFHHQSYPARHHLGWSWIGFLHPFINFFNQLSPARHHLGWSWIELLSFVKSSHLIYFLSRSPPLRLVLDRKFSLFRDFYPYLFILSLRIFSTVTTFTTFSFYFIPDRHH